MKFYKDFSVAVTSDCKAVSLSMWLLLRSLDYETNRKKKQNRIREIDSMAAGKLLPGIQTTI